MRPVSGRSSRVLGEPVREPPPISEPAVPRPGVEGEPVPVVGAGPGTGVMRSAEDGVDAGAGGMFRAAGGTEA